MKLGVTTICPHIFWDGMWWSYEPFVLEMNVWAELFDGLVMIAPLENGPPPDLWRAYLDSHRISVISISKNKGHGLDQPRTHFFDILGMLQALVSSVKQCDAYHLRSPGNISMIASILVPLWSKRICAKYAGMWPALPGESLSNSWQKKILSSKWFHGPVTVYGNWVGQPKHIKPFFTSVMGLEQVKRAKDACENKQLHAPLRVIFVGRLSRAKNVRVLINAIEKLKKENILMGVRIIGDGPEMPSLQQQVANMQLSETISFMGGLPFEDVLLQYEWADVLVLASETEGWPKALAEAMTFGLVCIGSNRGLVPQMLANGRGLLVEPGNEIALATALQEIAVGKVDFVSMSHDASFWAQRYSLDGLREAIRDLLIREWHLTDDMLKVLP